MFANTSFGKNMELSPEKILTIKASSIKWEFIENHDGEYPWLKAIKTGKTQVGNQLMFTCISGEKRTFMVNSSPIQDGDGKYRGVLATFDDITQVEEKNGQLEKMLRMVKKSRDEEKRLKEKMQILATRDPMTNCLNRRSFFEEYEPAFNAAINSSSQLTCIMTDIDLFKSINDNYGHGLGDEVIISVASALQDAIPLDDMVCRYGGEEFCIVLPDVNIDEATRAAELARKAIENSRIENQPKIRFTASFGISTIMDDSNNLSDLIDQADQALYLSKENGRNRVTTWSPPAENTAQDASPAAKSETPEPSSQQVTVSPMHTAESHDATSLSSDDMTKPEHDSLTGLPNRRLFYDRVMEAIKHSRDSGQYMAIMMLDLDMFKRINNALGYKVGDDLLLAVSQRLQDKLRKTDSVSRLTSEDPNTSIYRLGGDEFGILLSGMESADTTELIVKRIIDSVTEPLEIDQNEIHLTCSMGISVFPGNGIDTDSLLKNAGMALYYAKRHGHNTYQFYDRDNTHVSLEKLKLETDLRHAMERNELALYYQPKIEIHSGKIIGMEGLLRWKHPTLGMIPPVEFIPMAEETGLIHKLGEWVLTTACDQLKEWESTDYQNISIAVNLSAIQFQQKDLLGNIRKVLDNSGANPKLLELEITESTIMQDLDTAAAIMRELHKEGIRISIDDFGTGYSSLNHLKRFPISTVKIDRSFVRDITTDPDDAAIVGAIIVMAHSMGMRIIAEGVETEQQLEYMRRLRCDEIQGFLFSPALPKNEVEELLERDKNGTAFTDTESRAVS
ncbi:MAG: diguanylate cyclase [Gammaproteobacteria bacterium]|nr:diguanylate cyclase [Gammaproteobacteria bacterium]